MAPKPDTAPSTTWVMEGRPLWIRTALVFLLGFIVLTALYAPSPLIYDADSYYHLAVARGYAEEGLFEQLKWVRFGLLAEHFGDKEVLFHLVLIPFAHWMEPVFGGHLALTLFGALILAIIGALSLRAVGSWGMLVPFWLLVGSLEFTWRMVRLRPELASLIVLLLALWAAARRRYLVLGLLSAIYALTYTAVHAYLGIFFLIFLAQAWALGRWRWQLFLYPLLGAGIGLAIHPQFPDNLMVWWFQSVEYFRFKGVLDVGNEIQPMRTDLALLVNFGWLLGLFVLWRASDESAERQGSEAALVFGAAAAAFGALYVMMSRFALYFVVLTTLWLLFEIHRRGRRLSTRVRLPWRGRLSTAWAWTLVLLLSLPVASYELGRYRFRNDPGPDGIRLADRERFASALPAGAKVANPWRSTPIYMYWAPQGRYLNVLDPVFLAAWNPTVYQAQKEIFAGTEPDVPMVAATLLDSEFVAFSAATGSRDLTQRLVADPRVEPVYQGINLLFRLRPPTASPFLVDWWLVPPVQELPPPADVDIRGWRRYPSSEASEQRWLEGFIDGRRVPSTGRCLALVHELEQEAAGPRLLELAPLGPSTIWLDGRVRAEVLDSPGAVLGRGVLLPLDLESGPHRLTVLSCADPETERVGFYLRELRSE